MFIALSLFLLGALTASLLASAFSSSPMNSLSCVSGKIVISGSGTFSPLVETVAQNYQENCPGATITIAQTSSTSGLFDVEAGSVYIATSGIPASAGQADLVDHKVAVVVFAAVINRNVTGVINLSTNQLQGIYSGTITNWKQVGGPDLPITVVSLPPTSDIRATFEKYILGGSETLPSGSEIVDSVTIAAQIVQATPGAIGYVDLQTATQSKLMRIISIDQMAPISGLIEQNNYKFWTVVHMYTKGTPPSNSLTNAFIQYMYGDYAKVVATHLSYININEMSNSALSTHQST